jgi:superfamily II DNA or RNA helicase
VAPPGIGKTVAGIYLIAKRARNTLILVHRQPLLDQWIAQLALFLDVDPQSIGRLGGGKRAVTGAIDVAMLQSVVRKDAVADLVAEYGHVVVDECHHVPAVSFERVLSEVQARYVTGLTATPKRRDGQHPIVEMQLGPARYVVDQRSQAAAQAFQHRLIVRKTEFDLPEASTDYPIQRPTGLSAALRGPAAKRRHPRRHHRRAGGGAFADRVDGTQKSPRVSRRPAP